MNKSKLFKTAWAIADKFDTFAQALKQAWKLFKLKSQMKTNNVVFQFKKVSGEIRNAVGTLTETYESKGTGKQMPNDSFLYFDVEVGGFRSLKIFNLI